MNAMNKKKAHHKFNGFHTPSLDRDPTPDIPLPRQFAARLSPGAACYRPRSENEPLLPEVPLSQTPENQQNARPPSLMIKPAQCENPCSCNHPSRPKDYGSENVNPTQCPQHCPPLWIPPMTDNNPSGASMSDIELAMNDEDGQNMTMRGATSHLSNHCSMSRCFDIASPIDNTKQPSFPVPPRMLHVEWCRDDFCDRAADQCMWHYCVLKYPQYVKWQDEVQTVLLKRELNQSFGFSTKAMKHNEEAKEEMYVLVDKVKRNSNAAKSGLAVGDMILSINGNPLQTEKKYHEVAYKGKSELKMQIQRPLQLLDKASEIFEDLNKSGHPKSRIVEPVSPPMSPDQVPGMEKQPFEAIPLLSMKRSESRPAVTSHSLPQARVFLCGNCTLDFVRCMFGNLITVSADSQAFTFQVSMEKLSNGSVRIDNSKAFCYMMEDSTNSSINLEVIAVLNDDFFLNLCSWMFTPRSVFIVTFDTRKLSLSNDSEMARLSALANTILSHGPVNSENLQLFGMRRPGDDATLEEVQTLFYTSLAASLPEQKIMSLSATDTNAIKNVQQDLFNLLTQISEKRTVLSITANVIDHLIINPNLIISKQELYHSLPEWITASPDVNDLFKWMVDELQATGNLIGVGREIAFEDPREFVIPCKFLECLARLIQGMEKEPTSSTFLANFEGLLSEMDLLELIAKVVPCPQHIISYMKELNIVYPVKCNHQDSGFCEPASLLPYFIKDRPFHMEPENYQEILLADCKSTFPISVFFHLLSNLSFQDKCVITAIESRSVFRICLDLCELLVHLEKGKNKIHIFSHRNQKPVGKVWLQNLVHTSLPHNIVGSVVWKEPSEVLEERSVVTSVTPAVVMAQMEDNGRERPGDFVEDNVPLPHPKMQAENKNGGWELRRETEQLRILNLPMLKLRLIHDPLQDLYSYMSIDDNWQRWAGYLGLTLEDTLVYLSIIRNNGQALSGKTFFLNYIKETRCSLSDILSSLSSMAQLTKHRHCDELATHLWRVAWENNSAWPP